MAVFVDGCFWHGCPEHFVAPNSNVDYWRPKIQRNRERDVRVDAALREAGWTVLRAWEHEDPTQVAEAIDRLVRKHATSQVAPQGRAAQAEDGARGNARGQSIATA